MEGDARPTSLVLEETDSCSFVCIEIDGGEGL